MPDVLRWLLPALLAFGPNPALADDAEAEAFFDNDAPRAPRPPREERREPEAGMETFRIEVGHRHGVKPGNIAALRAVADVDGALVGGASLDVAGFAQIVTGAIRSGAATAR